MIINKLVFPIKADLSFVEGGIPQGKLTANSINRDILYVISPAVKGTVITAFFQNQKQTENTQQATFVLSDLSIDYLVSKDTSYYELVKDWNVWQTPIPSKALEFISYNRAGKIGISFAFRQLLEPSGYEGSQEIKSDDFVITNSGNYIIKVPYYHFLGNDFTYNDVLIYNGGSEVSKKPAIALQGTTGTLEYSVDPSVYMGGYEIVEISLTESILSKLQSLEAEVILVEEKVDTHIEDLDNPHNVKADQVEYVPNENVKEALDRSAKVDEENVFTERQEFIRGIYTDTIEMDSDARITYLGDGINPQDAVNKSQLDKKVDKTQTIIGIDLQDNILLGEFKEKLGEATQSVAGLLSAEDKTHLDGLVALLETSDGNNVVDTIGEILDIFQNYPEGADLVTVLQGKVDKVAGKGLSTNDFTDALKNKLNTLEISKQDKLVAGDNITIDENNVISASGVDPNTMAYFDYAGSIYGDKYDLLKNAWEHSLTVSVIDKNSYPDGDTEGVIIPQGVRSIGNSAFFNWPSNNQPLVIPNSVTSIGYGAFSDWSANNQPLTIPNSVTSIGDAAFFNWPSNNQPLVIPNSVTSIGYSAFSDWSANNQPLTIPNSVIGIDRGAFYSWTANNHPLIIPNSVTSIGDYAFSSWSSVPYIEMQRTTPPTIFLSSFSNQNDAPIYVPDESVDDYKTAPKWVDLADRIFPISDRLVGGGGSIDEVDGATTPIMLKTGSQETLDEDDTLKERELVYSSDKNIFGIYYDNKIRWQGAPLVIEPIIRVRSFGASDSKLSYVGMSPTLKLFQDGDINYYTNDVFDTMYPFKDMKEVEDELGNKFIEIPPFYVKYIVDENDIITGYDIANYKVDEDYGISQAFIDVISGEVKPLWFGKYMANVDGNDKMTSKSGVMADASKTLAWFRQRAKNNGLGYYQNSLYSWQIVQMLMWTYFGSINSDDFFPDINYGSYLNNGSMDSVPYKVAYDSTTGKNTFFGIENILKEKRHFIDGVLLNIPNMYVAKDFRKFATNTTTNYDLVSTSLPTTSAYIVSMAYENGVMYPKVITGGSSGTYFADYYYQATGNRILYGGSYSASYADTGLSAWTGYSDSSFSFATVGSRLMYSPLTPTE